jgi:hypothetical protein
VVDVTTKPNCDIVEQMVAILRRNREEIERLRPCQLTIHLPPPEDPKGQPCLELGKIKIR